MNYNKLIKSFVELADKLDSLGLNKEADELDGIIKTARMPNELIKALKEDDLNAKDAFLSFVSSIPSYSNPASELGLSEKEFNELAQAIRELDLDKARKILGVEKNEEEEEEKFEEKEKSRISLIDALDNIKIGIDTFATEFYGPAFPKKDIVKGLKYDLLFNKEQDAYDFFNFLSTNNIDSQYFVYMPSNITVVGKIEFNTYSGKSSNKVEMLIQVDDLKSINILNQIEDLVELKLF